LPRRQIRTFLLLLVHLAAHLHLRQHLRRLNHLRLLPQVITIRMMATTGMADVVVDQI